MRCRMHVLSLGYRKRSAKCKRRTERVEVAHVMPPRLVGMDELHHLNTSKCFASEHRKI